MLRLARGACSAMLFDANQWLRETAAKDDLPTMRVRAFSNKDDKNVQRILNEATKELRHVYRPRPDSPTTANPNAPDSANRHWHKRVVEDSNTIRGVVEYLVTPKTIRVRGLAVDRTARKKGFAKALLRSLEKEGARHGAKHITLSTVRETGNVPFFIRLGFSVVNERVSTRFEHASSKGTGPVTEIDMEKPISF